MNDRRPTALQLCPLSAQLEAGINQRFHLIRWFDLNESEQSTWLAQCAPRCEPSLPAGMSVAATN